jgi:hypothetical protein
MHASYGSYDHPAGLTAVTSLQIEALRDERTGARRGVRQRWVLEGELQASGATDDLKVADLTSKIQALEAAYSLDGKDLKLVYTGGSGPVDTAHALMDAETLGGVKVLLVDWLKGRGPEYAVMRSYRITVEGEIEDAGLANLVSFQEMVSVQGTGGPRRVMLVPLEGDPVEQETSERTPIVVTQSGDAIGRTAYPSFPAPKLTAGEVYERRTQERRGPDRQADGTYRNYGIRWSYEYIVNYVPAASSLPNIWGS